MKIKNNVKFGAKVIIDGVGFGRVFFFHNKKNQIIRRTINSSLVANEIKRFEEIKKKACTQLSTLIINNVNSSEVVSILKSHLTIINDPMINHQIEMELKINNSNFEYAIFKAYDLAVKMLEGAKNQIIIERISDITDVKNRLLKLANDEEYDLLVHLEEDIILIADEVYPSDIINFKTNKIKGLILNHISPNSHTAILARGLNLHPLLQVSNIDKLINNNDFIYIDTKSNYFIINPNDSFTNEIKDKINEQIDQSFDHSIFNKATTLDKIVINIFLNYDFLPQPLFENKCYADGIGLLRTEMLYMEKIPSLEYQIKEYRNYLSAFKDTYVTIRTFDLGSDKTSDYLDMKNEENPSLGIRGIRLAFEHIELFKIQIEALLIANEWKNLKVMFPMVTSYEEVKKIKLIIEEVKNKLNETGVIFNDFLLGIMIETPAIVYTLEDIIEEVDFLSIGSNDLTQYIFAADRTNNELDIYHEFLHPALLKAFARIIYVCDNYQKELSICGNLASDIKYTSLLIAIGFRNLSVSPSVIKDVKHKINKTNITSLRTRMPLIFKCKTYLEILDIIKLSDL